MIELEGHETIIKNAVFGQLTSDFLSKYITVVNLYQESNFSDVWNHLSEKIKGVRCSLDFGLEPETELGILISLLPDDVLKNFSDYMTQFQELLTGNIPEDSYPKKILEITYGVLPLESLTEGNGNPRWYVETMHTQGINCRRKEDILGEYDVGESIHIEIGYKDGVLPFLETIQFLCDHAVHGSRTLEISTGEGYDPLEVMALVSKVYQGLEQGNSNDLQVFNALEDLSIFAMEAHLKSIGIDGFNQHYIELSNFPEPEQTDFDH